MKISRDWLQTYFEQELPHADVLSDALTFHAFEIDGVDIVGSDTVLDVKVTPNRGHDCLCHVGIAKELSAILKLPLKRDPLAGDISTAWALQATRPQSTLASGNVAAQVPVSVSIESPLCKRYIAGYIKGIKVGASPEWLKARLEALGQRSINNVVDATNYVMFDLGQPLHAFDAGKLDTKDAVWAIAVRNAHLGEKLFALDGKEYALNESMLVIADKNKGSGSEAIGIAGVKGGTPASITEDTTEIILESANFDGTSVRKTAQALKLRTDASQRFEQVISPDLAAYGMHAVVALIQEIAGGELVSVADVYPEPEQQAYVSVTTEKVARVLGAQITGADVADAFQRLGFAYKEESGVFEVQPPFQRLDILISEDLVEEVGRVMGYDKVSETPLPAFPKKVEINKNFYAAEEVREQLITNGFSEVFTSVFAEKGERVVLNKVDGTRPYLRTNLVDGLTEALKKNIPNKDLLGLTKVKLFEIGTVWRDSKEALLVGTIVEGQEAQEKALVSVEVDAYDALPLSTTERYQPFSKYPYIVRDVAFWTPTGTDEKILEAMIQNSAEGHLLQRVALFDRFEKAEKTSFAFRLIFQSFEKTLTDDEVNPVMERVYTKLKEAGFEIR